MVTCLRTLTGNATDFSARPPGRKEAQCRRASERGRLLTPAVPRHELAPAVRELAVVGPRLVAAVGHRAAAATADVTDSHGGVLGDLDAAAAVVVDVRHG